MRTNSVATPPSSPGPQRASTRPYASERRNMVLADMALQEFDRLIALFPRSAAGRCSTNWTTENLTWAHEPLFCRIPPGGFRWRENSAESLKIDYRLTPNR